MLPLLKRFFSAAVAVSSAVCQISILFNDVIRRVLCFVFAQFFFFPFYFNISSLVFHSSLKNQHFAVGFIMILKLLYVSCSVRDRFFSHSATFLWTTKCLLNDCMAISFVPINEIIINVSMYFLLGETVKKPY